jgi:ketosteroid isomerase-like protein
MGGTEAEEVRAAVGEMIDAQNAGDAGRLRPLLSERTDAVHIGTDSEEWWTSKEILDEVAAGGGGDIQVIADDLDVHVQGDVAWVAGRGRFTNRSGGQRPVRMTGVLVREQGRGRWCSRMLRSGSRTGISSARWRVRREPASEEVAQFPVSAIGSIFRGALAKMKRRLKATAANSGSLS